MPVFTDLEKRIRQDPFDEAEFHRRLPDACRVAEAVHLIHVSGKGLDFVTLVADPPHEIPTSEHAGYCTNDTRRAEDLLALLRSAYFYAGRAHPDFGNVALAFAPDCQDGHTGSATPFDTGGLVHPKRYIRIELNPNDDEAPRVEYGKASQLELNEWREVFGRVLAAYFDDDGDYWERPPARTDPEKLYELNDCWRSWTFEIRFYEPQSIHSRVTWCSDEMVMSKLRRMQDD